MRYLHALILPWLLVGAAQAASVTLDWTAPTALTDGTALEEIAGYRIYSGCEQSGQYERYPIMLGPWDTVWTVDDLPDQGSCYFVITAYADGIESDPSTEAVRSFGVTVPPGTPGLSVSWGQQSMTFPVVESVTETSFSAATTSHDVSMPAAVNSGDLLLILFSAHEGGAPTLTTPTGWAELYNGNGGSFIRGAAYTRTSDGTEGGTTVDVQSSVAEAGSAHVYRISGWNAVEASTLATFENGTSRAPNALTPSWGAKDTLWIVTAHTGDDDEVMSSAPTNYANTVDTVSGGGDNNSGRTCSARRTANTATETPDSFTISASEAWVLATIGVEPAAGETGSISEAAAADATFAGVAAGSSALSAPAQAGDQHSALATAIAAINAGIDAGEQWAALAAAEAQLSAGASLGDTFTGATQAAQTAGLSAGTQAASTFVGAAQAFAALSEGAQADDTFVATAGAAGQISAGADLAAAFTATAQAIGELLAAIEAADVFSAVHGALSSFTAGAVFSDTFAATSSLDVGLINEAITLHRSLKVSIGTERSVITGTHRIH